MNIRREVLIRAAVTVAVVLLMANVTSASNWAIESPSEQTYLLELFTSQGCSSCPPADAWLSRFRQDPELFNSVVPVAYHVTYWDYLGWKDTFGHTSHDVRHRSRAGAVGASVYTPGVFLQGKEWRGWRRQTLGRQDSTDRHVGVLEVMGDENMAVITFRPNNNSLYKHPRGNITFLRSGQTNILSGENRSRDLHYDFIAGEVRSKPLEWIDDLWSATFILSIPGDADSVAVWVEQDNGVYIQSTGGFLTQ